MAIVQFQQVSLCVGDLERSLRFYRDLLGCRQVAELSFAGETPARTLGVAAAEFRAALLGRDGLRLELICFAGREEPSGEPPPRADRVGLSHLTFAVDDLSSSLHSLRDRGVEVLEETHTELASGVATCLIRDPDGQLVLLLQQPPGVATPWDGFDE